MAAGQSGIVRIEVMKLNLVKNVHIAGNDEVKWAGCDSKAGKDCLFLMIQPRRTRDRQLESELTGNDEIALKNIGYRCV